MAFGDQSLQVIVKLVDNASAGLTSLSDKFDSVGQKVDKSTEGAQKFTKAITAVGLAVGAYALNTFADFEKTMSGVKAVLDPTTEQFGALSEKVKQLGKDTIYSQGEIAKATEDLAKNGLNSDQILNGAIEASANFASAAGTNLSTAAGAVSDALNIFKLSADDVTLAVDQMTGVTIASKFGAEDYALALAQGGAAAKVAGVSFEDFNTTIAAIWSAFSSGSDAGTSFKTFTQRLIPQSDNAAAAMERLGLEFFDATWKIKPMRDIADELKTGLHGLSDEQRNAALTTIFGSDAMRAAAMIAETGAEGYDKLAASIAKTDAAAQSATRLDNFWGSMEKLKGTIDVLATTLGEKIAGALRPVIDGLANALEDLGAWFQNLSPQMQLVIEIVGGVAAGFGALLLAVGAIGIFLPMITGALAAIAGALAFVMSPLGLIIAWIVALGTAFATNFLGFRDIVMGTWAVLSPILAQIWKGFEDTFTKIMAYVELVKVPLMTIWTEIQPVVLAFLDILGTAFISTFGNIIQFVGGAFEVLKGIFDLAIAVIGGAITLFLQVMAGDWSGAWETIKLTASVALDAIKLIFSGALEMIKAVFSQFATWIKLWFGTLWSGISLATTVVFDTITNVISGAFEAIGNIFNLAVDTLSKVWGGFTAGLGNVMTSTWEAIKTTIANSINWIIDKINAAIDLINGATWKIGGPQIPKIGRVAFEHGGIAGGTGIVTGGTRIPGSHDMIPAMLDPGELILNRAQQSNVASQLMGGGQQSGGTTLVVQVTGNSFFWSDDEFVEKIGDSLIDKFQVHMAVPSY